MYNIEVEIEDILDEQMFLYFHESVGHTLTEHVVSHSDLIRKIKTKTYSGSGITITSTFYSKRDALLIIHKAVSQKIDEIKAWRKRLLTDELILMVTLERETGYGVCKEANYSDKVKLHGVRVVLIANDKNGRAFAIKTAYPVAVFEDIDEINDKIDDYQSKKKNR